MSSSSEIFEKVRAATDIVDIVGECVALKRAGREFKGLCPFHDDHKPSMAVVPTKQIFHCFVCGTGGDVFKFVKEFHKLTNGEALRMLAQRAGIQLPDLPKNGRGGGNQSYDGPSIREQIATTNEWACTFFEKHLRTPAGKPGLDYLHSRGLTDETIIKFRLGMAPDSWTALTTAALRANIKTDLLSDSGLIKKRSDGSPYDVFRNRVIFPIIDATGGASGTGRVIAFGGRVLAEKRDEQGMVVEAKYLNSPETALFNKSASMYGLNHARQQIVRTRTAVVVEGYMDVIACHQVGVTNVIATLGTALTPEHARALKNFAQTIVLVFDSDDAGKRAADRAMEVFVHTPLDIKIASVPDGKDPFDYCMRAGGDAFQKLVENAPDAMRFKWSELATRVHTTDSLTTRQDAITEFLRFTASTLGSRGDNMDPIRRGQLIVKISNLVGLSVDEVTQTLFRLTRLRPTSDDSRGQSPLRPALTQTAGWAPDALADAESWLMGFIINNPTLYRIVRDDMSLHLFTRYELQAALFIEYFDNTDSAEASLAGFCSFMETKEAADQALHSAMLWERLAATWVDLPHLSVNTAKLVHMLREELGHTPERVVMDCFQYLVDAAEDRMRIFSRNQSALDPEAALQQHLQEIRETSVRNSQGKNRNKVGYHKPTGANSESFEAMRRVAKAG